MEYLIFPTVWKNEVCKGLDPKRVADVLRERGWLRGATKRHPAPPVSIPGHKKQRFYRISDDIFGDDQDENEPE